MSDFDGIDMSVAEPIDLGGEPQPLTPELLLECMRIHDERMLWLQRNPIGSEKNPLIVSPQTYRFLKSQGWVG